WLDAGAVQLVVEGREKGRGGGLFDQKGKLNTAKAERLVEGVGLEKVMFENPNKPNQFGLVKYLCRQVHLCKVRLEKLSHVEIYRRGLHSDAFGQENLRPGRRGLLAA